MDPMVDSVENCRQVKKQQNDKWLIVNRSVNIIMNFYENYFGTMKAFGRLIVNSRLDHFLSSN